MREVAADLSAGGKRRVALPTTTADAATAGMTASIARRALKRFERMFMRLPGIDRPDF